MIKKRGKMGSKHEFVFVIFVFTKNLCMRACIGTTMTF